MAQEYTLMYPIKMDGKEISNISIRRPLVRDLRRMKNLKNDTDMAIRLLADLAEISEQAVESMDAADFRGASEIVAGYVNEGLDARG